MPEDKIDPRRLVRLAPERVSHVSSTDYPGHWPGEANTWDLAAFRENLRIPIHRLTPSTITFDILGADASLANALRRILLAEVETVAIEHVFVWQNTSVMQDEVLAARLGLVPLRIHPGRLESWTPDSKPTDANTIAFALQVACTRRPTPHPSHSRPNPTPTPDQLYDNSSVYASALTWQPVGHQSVLPDWLADPPAPAAPHVLLCKLRPGQELNIEMHCIKSCGREHAKWSPCATATYRLMPHIEILKPVPEHLQDKFVGCFSPGVIGRRRGAGGRWEVYVKDARRDTVSRNVFMHPEFEGCVRLSRVRDHFLFTIESAGQLPPQVLLPEALAVLRRKLRVVSAALEEMVNPGAAEQEQQEQREEAEVEAASADGDGGMEVDR